MLTFEATLMRLRAGRPFAFSRWGDGEWAAVLGQSGATCDGQPYTPALAAALGAVLQRVPTYHLGMQGFARRRLGQAIDTWLRAHHLQHLTWDDADILARASLAGQLGAFVAALRTRPVVLVTSPALIDVDGLVPAVGRVLVSPTDAFGDIDTIWARLAGLIEAQPTAVVLCSAGPTANLLVDRGARAFPAATWVDVGSLWEPYLGRATRTYHQAILTREAARPSLGVEVPA